MSRERRAIARRTGSSSPGQAWYQHWPKARLLWSTAITIRTSNTSAGDWSPQRGPLMDVLKPLKTLELTGSLLGCNGILNWGGGKIDSRRLSSIDLSPLRGNMREVQGVSHLNRELRGDERIIQLKFYINMQVFR